MVLWESPRQCSSWTLCEGFCWLLLLPVMLLIVARPVKLAAFPTSLSDCQTPTGWNCSGYDDRENDLFLCDTNTCKFDGECLRIGDTVTCVCQFKCNNDYVPVCGSNGESYQNECYLRQAACKHQSEILVVSEGSCATDAGSGSGDGGRSCLFVFDDLHENIIYGYIFAIISN
uniref:Transmembrane protein with EGF like and two follistatin like domains 2 n=1 Tax=Rousettus aegyptiacus TaxID=9407 RepID=A0A7J8JN96_ROUAE|nr:transmembrane protein with EGF like and two follistatin like domains 2 [Rousettus aegyptiacus]